MNELELKAQAFRERIAELTLDYEEKIVNFRIQITFLQQHKTSLEEDKAALQENVVRLNARIEELEKEDEDVVEVIDAEVAEIEE